MIAAAAYLLWRVSLCDDDVMDHPTKQQQQQQLHVPVPALCRRTVGRYGI
jgi:hypothetical protein